MRKINDSIYMLEIGSGRGCYYPTLLRDGDELILADTGSPGQFEQICAQIRECGFEARSLTKIILTHHDIDHIGCLRGLKMLSHAEVCSHEIEAPYINGRKTAIKLARLESRSASLTDSERGFYNLLKSNHENILTPVERVFRDGELLPFCGGIEVLHTPGHTPGHICLFVKGLKLIISGDAMNIVDGMLTGANSPNDMEQADNSFERLVACEPDYVISYHCGLYTHEGIDEYRHTYYATDLRIS